MTVDSVLHLRVAVPDVWDILDLDADGAWTVERLKAEALARATGRPVAAAEYVVKFRGARVYDESQRLSDLGVPDRASLIVLSARRRPVR